MEEPNEGDVAHGADVVIGPGIIRLEIDVRGIQRRGVGPGSDGSLVEDAVLDSGVESLNAPMQRALCRTRHDVTTYSTRWIVAAVKYDTTESQDRI